MTIKIQWHRFGLATIDALLVAIALYAGYMLRFEFHVSPEDQRQYLLVTPALVMVRISCFYGFMLYRGVLRYASTAELYAIFTSTVVGTVVLSFANLFLAPMVPAINGLPEFHGKLQRLPWSIVVIEFVFTLLLIGGAHFSRRVLVFKWFRRESAETQHRVLVVGAGDAGEALARHLLTTEGSPYVPVAFVDDDPNKKGMRIHGLTVAGTTSDLGTLIEHHKADEVLIAMEKAEPEHLRNLLEVCRGVHVGFKIVPSVNELLAGRVSINQIRPVEIEDLLGRDPVRLELPAGENYVDDQVIMVTGAGGSIGSELCRQLLNLNPKRIVLYGHGENSIYDISMELSVHVDAGIISPVIGDIRDSSKLRATIAHHFLPRGRPQTRTADGSPPRRGGEEQHHRHPQRGRGRPRGRGKKVHPHKQ
jgi:FlaA1/EpsC-like NDP-sugar epimerase